MKTREQIVTRLDSLYARMWRIEERLGDVTATSADDFIWTPDEEALRVRYNTMQREAERLEVEFDERRLAGEW